VLIDANHREERRRLDALGLARRCGVPVLILVCRASPETTRQRLAGRTGDVSDADWAVYQETAPTWQEFGSVTGRFAQEMGEGAPEVVLGRALEALRSAGLLAGDGATS
jgi:predicted kinase